tara:strand:+ start:7646 stop:8056 length:411 start_codon:yes stop_codon:yes gene_type:complete
MPRRQSKYKQSGGMHGTPLPSEYFGINSGKYFPEGSPELGNMQISTNVEPPVIQSGGMQGTPLPSEYFGINSGKYFAAGSPELGTMKISTSVEPNVTSQTGGYNAFNYIINPSTGKKVSLFGKKGKEVLKNYVKNL